MFLFNVLYRHIFSCVLPFFFVSFSVFCCHSLLLSILFILPCSVKVREGSNYWGPLGYETLTSPKSPQSPDPRAASKRVHIFKFRKRTDSKIPLCQRHKRWDFILCVCVFSKGNSGNTSWSWLIWSSELPGQVHLSICVIDKFELTYTGVILAGRMGWAQWRWTRRNALKTSKSGCVWFWKTTL